MLTVTRPQAMLVALMLALAHAVFANTLPAPPVQVRVIAVSVTPPTRRLLQQQDVSYLGSCVLPDTLASVGEGSVSTRDVGPGFGAGYEQSEGLTAAVIGGAPYFIATADARYASAAVGGAPYRFHCTSFSANPASFPTATIDEYYGDAYDCKRVYINGDCLNAWWSGPGGLYYRNNGGTHELWWVYPPSPYQDDGDYASLGYSTLSIGGSSATGIAAYKFQNYNQALRTGSFLPIPAAWQSRFGGHTMMLTNKGIASNHGRPDPVIYVMDPPTGAHLTTITAGYTKVMGQADYSRCTTASSNAPSTRLQRPSWLPALHYNYWDGGSGDCHPITAHFNLGNTLGNESSDAFLFIDTGTAYGVLTFDHRAIGGTSYTHATIGNGGWTTGMGVIDPNDLARVYADSTGHTPDSVTFSSTWGMQYPVINYAARPFIEQAAPATIQANGITNRVRITFKSTFPSTVGEILAGYDATNTYYNTGYVVHEVITPGLVYDTCANQSCLDICLAQGHDLAYCQAYGLDLDDVPSSTITMSRSADYLGKVKGAVWMPTNSACGQDNTFAMVMDVDDGTGYHRYLHCYKVN